MAKLVRTILTVTLLSVFTAAAAQAAAVRSGATLQAIAAAARGNAVAFDSINHVYLVVSSHGVLYGRFVNASGTPIGAPFGIQANPANFAHFPRVAFSPDADGGAGGFLVTWHEGAPSVHGRMVSYGKSGPYGADTQLTGDTSWWEAGAAVAYSTASREFLVAWRSMPVRGGAANNDIHAARVDNNAALLAPVIAITNDIPYNDNPSVAYNPAANEFLVVYAGYNDAGAFAFADAQRVQAGTGALIGGPTRLVVTSGTYITDVSYNPASGKYLASWYSLPAGAALGRIVNADGSLPGNIITLSTRWKAYDALSVGYNTRSDTFFLVSHGPTAEDGGVELDTNGNPVDNGFVVTAAGGSGNFYPRLSASVDDPNWLVSTANNFVQTMTQLVAGSASGGAPSTPTSSPVTSAPAPIMNIDVPGNGSSVSTLGFQVAGWAIDRASANGPGVDAIHVYAWPTSGAPPVFLGVATFGISRPDVGAAFGSQFTGSGYAIMASGLPAGTYDLAVYARSTISGKFDGRVVRVTVAAPASNPVMNIDLPSANQNTSQNLTIAGWALDLASPSNAGVDAIHIYAYPAGGGNPVWLGAAALGGSRPDVGGVFGSRFNASGFSLNTSLGPGNYMIAVFARSSVTQSFNNVKTVTITVR